jgi:hypothetical protein
MTDRFSQGGELRNRPAFIRPVTQLPKPQPHTSDAARPDSSYRQTHTNSLIII